jgi:hypothetical protein
VFPISQKHSRFSWCLLCVDARDVLHDCEQEMARDGERVVMGLVQNHGRSLDVLKCGIVLSEGIAVLRCRRHSELSEVGESVQQGITQETNEVAQSTNTESGRSEWYSTRLSV